MEITNISTNMAIEGAGFFHVTLPDGTAAYTRAGDFLPDANGDLVTPDGYYLEPRVTIPDGASQVSISPTGMWWYWSTAPKARWVRLPSTTSVTQRA